MANRPTGWPTVVPTNNDGIGVGTDWQRWAQKGMNTGKMGPSRVPRLPGRCPPFPSRCSPDVRQARAPSPCERENRGRPEKIIGAMSGIRYDTIGTGYASTRREDPRTAELIHAALADARTVLNVGAGAGSYEPRDKHVVAVEPSPVMIAQRAPRLPPAIQAGAYPLPLEDDSLDAAMAILTIHHWDEDQQRGVREMRRVARGPVVILTFDAEVSSRMWLMADYLPEVAELDRGIFPTAETIASWLEAEVSVREVPIARDTQDWTLGSFWAHPERVLDPHARSSTSGFARMPPEVVNRVVDTVRRDLQDGTWDARHGHLRDLDEYDAGLRLLVSQPASSTSVDGVRGEDRPVWPTTGEVRGVASRPR